MRSSRCSGEQARSKTLAGASWFKRAKAQFKMVQERMQDFDRLIARFKQFGGMRLVWQYAKMGVLWLGIKEIIRCILHGRSLKAVYPVVTRLVDQELVNQYDTQSEIATIREHGSLRYGASAYDNANDNNFSQRRDAENQGSTVSLGNNLAESKFSQDNISIPSDNSQSASLRKEQSASSKLRKDSEPAQRLNPEASAEDLNQRASASTLNPLNHLEPASATSDLNSEASAEVLNQRSDLLRACSPEHLLERKNSLNSPSGAPIWFCWLQGMENAPELVKVCLESLRASIREDIIVLDAQNYTDYVTLPEYVTRKYRKGIIPPALFSDMLRLELLIKYGGTWIDSTVWASPKVGAKDSKCWQAWQKIQESELFIYRYFNREGRVEGMSNWFIHAEAGNALLKDVRDMLYAYWHDYNCTVEYYIFHLFFSHVAKRYPEMIRKMPKGNSYHALWLRDHVEREISKEDWQKLINNVPFHKLNWRKKVPKNLRGN